MTEHFFDMISQSSPLFLIIAHIYCTASIFWFYLSFFNLSGLGLGKTAQGRLDPVEAATCRGLGQIEEVEGLGLETDDGINQNNISGTKKPFGDALFTNIKTKPQGSGGEENGVKVFKFNFKDRILLLILLFTVYCLFIV